jgi:upstream activation factor subunit UAF30
MPKVKTSKSSAVVSESEQSTSVPQQSVSLEQVSSASVVPPSVPVDVSVAVSTKKPRALKKASVTESTSVASVSVSVSESVPHTEEVVAEGETSLDEQSVEFMSKLNMLTSMISTLKAEYRALEKKRSKELKAAQRSQSKRKRKAGNRAPSGFVKPTRISDELAKFLNKPSGSEMARTEVTRDINAYIKTHKLQDKDNGRTINPDSKLATLLNLKKTDVLTYFNLQRYMSPHFEKATKAVVSNVV